MWLVELNYVFDFGGNWLCVAGKRFDCLDQTWLVADDTAFFSDGLSRESEISGDLLEY